MAIRREKLLHYAETDGVKSLLVKQSERNAMDEFVKCHSNKESDENRDSSRRIFIGEKSTWQSFSIWLP